MVIKDDNRYVKLSWHTPKGNHEFRIYSGKSADKMVLEGSIENVKDSTYLHRIYKTRYQELYFQVEMLTDSKFTSEKSNQTRIILPTTNIPPLNVWPIAKENAQVTLNWKYAEIEDLKGFNIYENDILIDSVNVDTFIWQSPTLEKGMYTYQVEAVTKYGVGSGKSKPRAFRIE